MSIATLLSAVKSFCYSVSFRYSGFGYGFKLKFECELFLEGQHLPVVSSHITWLFLGQYYHSPWQRQMLLELLFRLMAWHQMYLQTAGKMNEKWRFYFARLVSESILSLCSEAVAQLLFVSVSFSNAISLSLSNCIFPKSNAEAGSGTLSCHL